ncbi:uncharacterized protein MYCGRDRAFT_94265 [Zymoseptoria tritici IPO323]|uniref:DUF427 domain-containing protein n=1 Tax=Zymoseptoria tritici (strain CBS 115943 / IPO323) TaxID=336722 RepID=F9XEN8_ZYMTI|nr:uncharacterized protein MYCGRDRAFT_94265 [Zymoseptoria tritici IPO323]EGP85573.1 hypothetical protein MYCGRDRAFT_94265 [Zymoseptoria tritici IPO323]
MAWSRTPFEGPQTECLQKLAIKLATNGPHKTLPTPRLIQLQHAGVFIIKTTSAVLVWEHLYYPQLYLPLKALEDPALSSEPGSEIHDPNTKARIAQVLTLTVASRTIPNVLSFSANLSGSATSLSNLVRIPFDAIDTWYEESTPIYVNPKDPFKRVDVLLSTRPIKVRIGGQVVASTTTSMHLYETGLPARYYMPLSAIDGTVLRKSDTRTKCPYKGEAEYYSVEVGGEAWKDVVWFYRSPILECAKIEGGFLLSCRFGHSESADDAIGLCCFYNEKVEIELDGEVLETPVTHMSNANPNAKPPAARNKSITTTGANTIRRVTPTHQDNSTITILANMQFNRHLFLAALAGFL